MPGSLTQTFATSFKDELFLALHNFNNAGGNAFKVALFITSGSLTGTYGAATTNYSNMTSNSDEVVGTGYSAGGNALTNSGVSTGGTTAFTSFSNTTWSAATFTTSGGLIYNTTNSNRAVCVLAWGSNIPVSAGNFTINFPSNDQNNAIIRLT
jgi:hypothetical protein